MSAQLLQGKTIAEKILAARNEYVGDVQYQELVNEAKKFLDLGFYVGFTGVVTFKNAKELKEVAKNIPLERLLIETDSPYLAPEPFRGESNQPQYVKYVAEHIAEIRQISYNEVVEATSQNAIKLFGLN